MLYKLVEDREERDDEEAEHEDPGEERPEQAADEQVFLRFNQEAEIGRGQSRAYQR